MRIACSGTLLALGLLAAGCDFFPPPKLAIPRGASSDEAAPQPEPVSVPVDTPKPPPVVVARPPLETPHSRYHGKTSEEWGQVLLTGNRDAASSACRALHILRSEGRPHLVQGLQSPNPETRRIALETLSVSDLRALGDEGRRILITLAGDHADMRIRDRATFYLSLWNQSIPAP